MRNWTCKLYYTENIFLEREICHSQNITGYSATGLVLYPSHSHSGSRTFLSSITKMPVPIYTGSGIFIIDSQNPFLLFYKCFYFFADAVCIKSVFLDQFNCRTRFPERIHNTNLQNRCRKFFRKKILFLYQRYHRFIRMR